jgi:peptidoglycan/xylan/chitin deacetylase (PgdA/CDA1 family)
MHGGPNAPRTADALPDIIKRLRLRGYTFVKVSDLLSLSGSKD